MKELRITFYNICFVAELLTVAYRVYVSTFCWQLMRELKEGLRIAVLHRQRYLTLIRTVLWDQEKETLDLYESAVSEFDQSMKAVLKVSHVIFIIGVCILLRLPSNYK
jgi:hypothetical protein